MDAKKKFVTDEKKKYVKPHTLRVGYIRTRGTSILGEVRHVEIWGVTQQLLCSKSHDFLAIFALAHSKINHIA